MSKANICIIGLSKTFTDKVCKQLSMRMEMYYANVQDILEFELMDLERVEKVCGPEYVLKEERSIIKRVCSYDNTIINVDYSSLNNDVNLEVITENCLLIYVRLDEMRFLQELETEGLTINVMQLKKDLYQDRDFICQKFSDITVDCDQLVDNDLIDVIIEKILGYYTV